MPISAVSAVTGHNVNQVIRYACRQVLLGMVAAAVLASPIVFGRTSPDAWAQPDESELTTHRHYRNKAGNDVHSPSKTKSGEVPTGASAKCADGTYSFSRHHSGTCSRHGGVAQWE